jgi:hypothetical protein
MLCDEAFDLEDTTGCPYRASAYTTRAVIMYDDLPAALRFLAESAVELDLLEDRYAATTVRSTAGMFAELAGDHASGLRHTDDGLRGARALANPGALTVALYGWGMARRADDPAAARAALGEALALIESGASDVVLPDILESLSRVECSLGEGERAVQTMARGLRVSTSAGYRLSAVASMWYLGEILGLLDREPEFAAVVHGFASQGPDAALVPSVQGAEAALHERALAAVERTLGAQRFAELTAQGAAMNFDEASDYTIAELDRINAR